MGNDWDASRSLSVPVSLLFIQFQASLEEYFNKTKEKQHTRRTITILTKKRMRLLHPLCLLLPTMMMRRRVVLVERRLEEICFFLLSRPGIDLYGCLSISDLFPTETPKTSEERNDIEVCAHRAILSSPPNRCCVADFFSNKENCNSSFSLPLSPALSLSLSFSHCPPHIFSSTTKVLLIFNHFFPHRQQHICGKQQHSSSVQSWTNCLSELWEEGKKRSGDSPDEEEKSLSVLVNQKRVIFSPPLVDCWWWQWWLFFLLLLRYRQWKDSFETEADIQSN